MVVKSGTTKNVMEKQGVIELMENNGGDEGIRTPDLYVANVPLSQLSYIPIANID